MNYFSSSKDENKKSDMLQPNYRFLPAPRLIRPYPHLRHITPIPPPPLLAMQLMMLRMRNSSPFLNETLNSNSRRFINSGK